MLDSISIGKKINHLRNEKNLNQEQLAEMLMVSRQAISRWELGLALPTIDNLVELVKIFEVSIEEILCMNEEKIINPDNIFLNHDRMYIIKKACNNDLGIPIALVFNQFSQDERMIILYSLKANKIKIDNKLYEVMSINEKKYWEE